MSGHTHLRFIEMEVGQGGVEELLLSRIERQVANADAPRVPCGSIAEDDP